MAEFSIEMQDGKATFVCALTAEETPDRFSIGMLKNNTIPGVLTPDLAESEGRTELRCSVDGLVSMSALFGDGIDRDKVLNALRTAAKAVLSGGDYMLSEAGFLLQPKMMFADPETGKAYMVYLPVDGYKNRLSLKRCVQKLLVNAVYEESGDLSYVARLINRISLCTELDAKALLDITSALEKEQAENARGVHAMPEPEGKQTEMSREPEAQAAPEAQEMQSSAPEPEPAFSGAPAPEEDLDPDKTWIDPESLTWGDSQGWGNQAAGWDAPMGENTGWDAQPAVGFGAAPQSQPDFGASGARSGEADMDDEKTWIDPDSQTFGQSGGWGTPDAAQPQGWGEQSAQAQGWGSQSGQAQGWGSQNAQSQGWGNQNAQSQGWGSQNAQGQGWGNQNAQGQGWGNQSGQAQGWGNQGAQAQGFGGQTVKPAQPGPAPWKPAASHEIYMDVNTETGRLEAPKKKKKGGLFSRFKKS